MFFILRHLNVQRNLSILLARNHRLHIEKWSLIPLRLGQHNYESLRSLTTDSNPNLEDLLNDATKKMTDVQRISRSDGDAILQAIRTAPAVPPEHTILALHCFGEMMPWETPAKRNELTQKLWARFRELNIALDINHYNALLKNQLDNESDIDPAEILKEIIGCDLSPTRRTYELLAQHYARKSDVQSILALLDRVNAEFGKSHVQLYNALIQAYGRNGDLSSAESVMSMMEQLDIEPNVETHSNLLCIRAITEDFSTIIDKIIELKEAGIELHHLDAFQIIETCASHGRKSNINILFKYVKRSNQFNCDAMNFILRLLINRHTNEVFSILDQMYQTENMVGVKGHFIIKQVVQLKWSTDDIIEICRRLNDTGLTSRAYVVFLDYIRHDIRDSNATDILTAMRALKSHDIPIGEEHFHVLFQCTRPDEIIPMVHVMTKEFGIKPTVKFTRTAIVHYLDVSDAAKAVLELRAANVPINASAQAVIFHCLRHKQLQDAANLVTRFRISLEPRLYAEFVFTALHATGDFFNYARLVRQMTDGFLTLETKKGRQTAHAAIITGSLVYRTIETFDPADRIDSINNIVECFQHQQLAISQCQADKIGEQLLSASTAAERENAKQLLQKIVTSTKSTSAPNRRTNFASSQMPVIELELIAKQRGIQTPLHIVSELLDHYHAQNKCDKYEQLLNQFTARIFTMGMTNYAQLIELQMNAAQPQKALDTYERAQRHYTRPFFRLDDKMAVKLAAALIECNETRRAIDFLDKNSTAARKKHVETMLIEVLGHYQHTKQPQKVSEMWQKLNAINAVPNEEFTKQVGSYLEQMNIELPFIMPHSKAKLS